MGKMNWGLIEQTHLSSAAEGLCSLWYLFHHHSACLNAIDEQGDLQISIWQRPTVRGDIVKGLWLNLIIQWGTASVMELWSKKILPCMKLRSVKLPMVLPVYRDRSLPGSQWVSFGNIPWSRPRHYSLMSSPCGDRSRGGSREQTIENNVSFVDVFS